MARFLAIPTDERTPSTDFIQAFDKPSLTRLHSWNGTMLLARSWVLMLCRKFRFQKMIFPRRDWGEG